MSTIGQFRYRWLMRGANGRIHIEGENKGNVSARDNE